MNVDFRMKNTLLRKYTKVRVFSLWGLTEEQTCDTKNSMNKCGFGRATQDNEEPMKSDLLKLTSAVILCPTDTALLPGFRAMELVARVTDQREMLLELEPTVLFHPIRDKAMVEELEIEQSWNQDLVTMAVHDLAKDDLEAAIAFVNQRVADPISCIIVAPSRVIDAVLQRRTKTDFTWSSMNGELYAAVVHAKGIRYFRHPAQELVDEAA